MLLQIPTHLPPTPIGEILNEEYLEPLGLTQQRFADALGIGRDRLNEILNGKRKVTVDTALRLARVLNTTAQFWLNLQLVHDLYEAQHAPNAAEIERLTPLISTTLETTSGESNFTSTVCV